MSANPHLSAAAIGNALVRQVWNRRCVIVVPECYWTGYECDLLCVDKSLKVIDIEIKTSAADFRKDAGKDKWWRRHGGFFAEEDGQRVWKRHPPTAREWPPRVWKHYFCVPVGLWKPELVDALPSPACGVITVRPDQYGGVVTDVVRRARPNPDAQKLDTAAVFDLARLAGLRMWTALEKLGGR